MPVPEPRAGESQDDFHSRCMEFLVGEEGYEQDQANAICYRQWRSQNSAKMPDIWELESPLPESICLVCTGTWKGHHSGKEMEITPAHIQSAYDYFERHYTANSAELVIDFEHQSVRKDGEGPNAPSAGWVNALEIRAGQNEIWGNVRWNDSAKAALSKREYRYLSPVLLFNAPDRVTGEPVLMFIHSAALTNTPFLTELPALCTNELKEDPDMDLLKQLAEALGKKPAEIAASLGVDTEASTEDVAAAMLAVMSSLTQTKSELKSLKDKAAEQQEQLDVLTSKLQRIQQSPVSESVANALGVEPGADENTVIARILAMSTGNRYEPEKIRERLGLPTDADFDAVCSKIDELNVSERQMAAEAIVCKAIEEGRVPPAHKDMWMQNALSNPDATQLALKSMPVRTERQPKPTATGGKRPLTKKEQKLADQLGLDHDKLASALTDKGLQIRE